MDQLDFSAQEQYCSAQAAAKLTALTEEIGAMLWKALDALRVYAK